MQAFDVHRELQRLALLGAGRSLEPSDEPAPAGARGVKTRKKRVTKKAAVVAAPAAQADDES